MAKSKQRQYQDALRVIKTRLGVTHKEAQAVYRFQRDKLGPNVPPSKFSGYSKSHLQRVSREAVTASQKNLFTGTDAAFDLRRLSSTGQVDSITPPKETSVLTVKFRPFDSATGKPLPEITVKRTNIKREDFWRVYHSMARDAISTFTGRANKSPDALLVASVSVL